jgi:DNA topoisomerase-1
MLRQRTYLIEFRYLYEKTINPKDLWSDDGNWITTKTGKHIFIGGVQRKRRPKKPLGVKSDSESWQKKAALFKFAITSSMARNRDRLDFSTRREVERKQIDRKKAVASVVRLMLLTGIRVGGGKDRTGVTYVHVKGQKDKKVAKTTYAATSLLKKHVSIKGNRVELNFRGKAGVMRKVVVTDKPLAESIRAFMGGKDSAPDDNSSLFQYKDDGMTSVVSRYSVQKRIKKFDPDYKPKDFRTLKANEVATESVAKILGEEHDIPRTEKGKVAFAKKIINRIGKETSRELGNKPSVALRNYVNPKLVETALEMLGLEI